MATFKVGQRVRILAGGNCPETVGDEVVILSELQRFAWAPYDELAHEISKPAHGIGGCQWCARPRFLAPLTDPGEDAWADAQVKKWTKPRPEILTEKVTQ